MLEAGIPACLLKMRQQNTSRRVGRSTEKKVVPMLRRRRFVVSVSNKDRCAYI